MKIVVAGALAALAARPDATPTAPDALARPPAQVAAPAHSMFAPVCEQGCSLHRMLQLHR